MDQNHDVSRIADSLRRAGRQDFRCRSATTGGRPFAQNRRRSTGHLGRTRSTRAGGPTAKTRCL